MSPRSDTIRRVAQRLVPIFRRIEELADATPEEVSRQLGGRDGALIMAASERRFHIDHSDRLEIASIAQVLTRYLAEYPLDRFVSELELQLVEFADSAIPLSALVNALRDWINDRIKKASSGHEWLIANVVKGLGGNDSFVVGRCHFRVIDDSFVTRWRQRAATLSVDPPPDSPAVPNRVMDIGSHVDQWVAEVRVHADDWTHASAKALNRVEEALSLLGTAAAWLDPLSMSYLGFGPLAGPRYGTFSLGVPTIQSGFHSGSQSARYVGYPYACLRELPGFEQLSHAIAVHPADRTELQIRLVRALRWTGSVTATTSRSVRLISLVIALESLLIKQHETKAKRRKLRERIQQLKGAVLADGQRSHEAVNKLYTLRSECVHGVITDVPDKAIATAIALVSDVLAWLAAWSFEGTSSLDQLFPTGTEGEGKGDADE